MDYPDQRRGLTWEIHYPKHLTEVLNQLNGTFEQLEADDWALRSQAPQLDITALVICEWPRSQSLVYSTCQSETVKLATCHMSSGLLAQNRYCQPGTQQRGVRTRLDSSLLSPKLSGYFQGRSLSMVNKHSKWASRSLTGLITSVYQFISQNSFVVRTEDAWLVSWYITVTSLRAGSVMRSGTTSV